MQKSSLLDQGDILESGELYVYILQKPIESFFTTPAIIINKTTGETHKKQLFGHNFDSIKYTIIKPNDSRHSMLLTLFLPS